MSSGIDVVFEWLWENFRSIIINSSSPNPETLEGGNLGRPKLSLELNQKIVTFLSSVPNIHADNTRRALVYSAGLDEQLQNQISFTDPTVQFSQLLVSTLDSYGALADGRNALESILLSIKEYVGSEKQKYCDALVQELQNRHCSRTWKAFAFDKAAERYSEKLRKECGRIQILNMASPLALKQIFIYVNVIEDPVALRSATKDQLERIEKEVYIDSAFGNILQKGVEGLKIVRENERVFIWGKPGGGKTTFLKYLTLEAIGGELNCIPIFITLRDFAETGSNLFDFIVNEFKICNLPDASAAIDTLLKNGESFELTERSFKLLHEDHLPKSILNRLQSLKHKMYNTKKDFRLAVEESTQIKQYIPLLGYSRSC